MKTFILILWCLAATIEGAPDGKGQFRRHSVPGASRAREGRNAFEESLDDMDGWSISPKPVGPAANLQGSPIRDEDLALHSELKDLEEKIRTARMTDTSQEHLPYTDKEREMMIKVLEERMEQIRQLLNEGFNKAPVRSEDDVSSLAEERDADQDKDDIVCVEKVTTAKEIVYSDVERCDHKFTKKCSQSVVTEYEATTERKCDTIYSKDCEISYEQVVYQEEVDVCLQPIKARCDGDVKGEEICTTQYETVCETRYREYDVEEDVPKCSEDLVEKCYTIEVEVPEGVLERKSRSAESTELTRAVPPDMEKRNKQKCVKIPVRKCDVEKNKNTKKVSPETECKKIPREVCAPSNCVHEKSEEVCNKELRNFVQNVPKEVCNLNPKEDCKMESVLVPRIATQESCFDVPKEVCTKMRVPKEITKPVITQHCFSKKQVKNSLARDLLNNIIGHDN